MEEVIEKLEEKIAAYSEVSKYRPEDEWLKGYISGIIAVKQEVELYKKQKK